MACGDVQAAKAASSSEHSKLRPAGAVPLSLPVNEKEALVAAVDASGCAVIIVSGAATSTIVQL